MTYFSVVTAPNGEVEVFKTDIDPVRNDYYTNEQMNEESSIYCIDFTPLGQPTMRAVKSHGGRHATPIQILARILDALTSDMESSEGVLLNPSPELSNGEDVENERQAKKSLRDRVFEALSNAEENGYDMRTPLAKVIAFDMLECNADIEGANHGDVIALIQVWREEVV